MILEHYSDHALAWPPRTYTQSYHKEGWGWPMKPEGLWVSVKGEDDWPWFCEAEDFRTDQLTHCTRVELVEDHNVLIVRDGKRLIKFDAEWGVDWKTGSVDMRRIDWPKLAEKYDGVIIAPYQWKYRLGGWNRDGTKDQARRISDWYYPWDCASGCIWNGKAIKSFELVYGGKEEAA